MPLKAVLVATQEDEMGCRLPVACCTAHPPSYHPTLPVLPAERVQWYPLRRADGKRARGRMGSQRRSLVDTLHIYTTVELL